MDIKIQFKYILPTDDGRERTVTRTFSKVNEEATNEDLTQFRKALGNIVKEENFIYRVTTEGIFE